MRLPPPVAALALATTLALAGCASLPEVGTQPLDLPPAEDLLPAEVPGYALGYTTKTPGDAAIDSLTRIFDGNANGTGMQLNTNVVRYAAVADAQQHFAFVTSQAAPNATSLDLGDEARLAHPNEGLSTLLVVRKGSVFWLAQHSVMAGGEQRPPVPDLVELMAPYVDRVD